MHRCTTRLPPTLLAATAADAAEVLVLQRACWVTEAIADDTLAIPALHEELPADGRAGPAR